MGYHYIAKGISDTGNALTRAMEERKRDGQLATVMRRQLSILNPERKGEFDAMGLDELQGEQQGMALQRAAEQMQARLNADRSRQQYYDFQLREGQAAAGRRDAFNSRLRGGGGGFDTELAATGAPMDLMVPGDLSREDVLAAAAESGVLTPELAQQLVPRGNFAPGEVRPVPGMPGYMFGVQNESGAGSFLPMPGAAPAKPETALEASRRKKMDAETRKIEKDLGEDGGPRVPAAIQKQIEELQEEIAEDEAAIAAGEGKRGFLNLASREANLAANKARLTVLQKHYGGASARPQGGKAPEAEEEEEAPKTKKQPDAAKGAEVRAQFKAGKISREEAVRRLRELGFE